MAPGHANLVAVRAQRDPTGKCMDGRVVGVSLTPDVIQSILERVWQSVVDCFSVPGPLAQLAEQATLNRLVVGSSPTWPTDPAIY